MKAVWKFFTLVSKAVRLTRRRRSHQSDLMPSSKFSPFSGSKGPMLVAVVPRPFQPPPVKPFVQVK